MQKITPCLWFDAQAEEAAKLYTSIFPNSKMGTVSRYGKEGFEFHHMPEGTAMVANFQLQGQDFMALNGGPSFKFSEAISFVVDCETQEEVDMYWNKLTADGGQESQCGWLKDKFGMSWQITPRILNELMADPDKVKAGRVMNAMLQMKKIDIAEIKKAYDGK
jgi:predicted 3-demethylubiquinone-9 3-methyltransferase (glyoxalase superfamily)